MSMFCWRSNTKASWKQKCSQCKRNYKTPNAFNIFSNSFLSFSEDKSQYTKVYKKQCIILQWKKRFVSFFSWNLAKRKYIILYIQPEFKKTPTSGIIKKYIDKYKNWQKSLVKWQKMHLGNIQGAHHNSFDWPTYWIWFSPVFHVRI